MLELMIKRYQALRADAELLGIDEEVEMVGLAEILSEAGYTSL
jgi:hypothetical protein